MLCPSLLRKEIGDLVLAIRAAFSSAFRSRVSVSKTRYNKVLLLLYIYTHN